MHNYVKEQIVLFRENIKSDKREINSGEAKKRGPIQGEHVFLDKCWTPGQPLDKTQLGNFVKFGMFWV